MILALLLGLFLALFAQPAFAIELHDAEIIFKFEPQNRPIDPPTPIISVPEDAYRHATILKPLS